MMDVMNKIKTEFVFIVSVITAAVIILYGTIFRDNLINVAGVMMSWVSNYFGWLYIIFVFFLCLFLAWLAFGKYGSVRLGQDDELPEYSNFHWFAMLFCGGTGIGLVFWSIAEPLSHYADPPEGITAGSIEAINFAVRTCFLHWGSTKWVCFALVALGIAFFQFKKGKNALISNLLSPLLGEKLTQGWFGKIVDVFSVVVSYAGVATSLGLGVTQISSGLNYLFGVPDNENTWLIIIVIISCVFLAGTITGVDKGIKLLASINTYIAFSLLLTVFLVGPKISIFNTLVNGVGQHIQNFFGDILMTNSFGDNSWIVNWRVFYYAWFIAWTPFVGLFIARISKGRTIREFIIGVVMIPTIFTIIWLSVFGTIALDTVGDWGIDTVTQLVASPQTAIFIVFSEYPLSKAISAMTICLLAFFFITSADSATYALGMMTSGGDINPPKYKEVIWATISATIAYVLLSAGSLKALQTISIVASLPFLFIMIAMCPALIKALKE